MLRGQTTPEAQRLADARGIELQRAGVPELNETAGDERYRISSKSFFQVSAEGAERLIECVVAGTEPRQGDTIGDFYAGVGLFALQLARRGAQVFAVENHPAALRDLRHNARGRTIRVVGRPVEAAAAELPARLDKVVADPPREGLSQAAVALLAQCRPQRIVLVSCDPASLARDVHALGQACYTLRAVQPIDLFPHTYHIEAVAWLDRRPDSVNEM
jgi:23S rRNA (uracil1939-C5)-methyltransferase